MRTLCLDCHNAIQLMPALLVPGRPVCGCGCLLAYAGEDCPNCMARAEWIDWAVKAERAGNLATFRRAA